MKIIIFIAVKNNSILHERVIVMGHFMSHCPRGEIHSLSDRLCQIFWNALDFSNASYISMKVNAFRVHCGFGIEMFLLLWVQN